jgi:hypothetical protein
MGSKWIRPAAIVWVGRRVPARWPGYPFGDWAMFSAKASTLLDPAEPEVKAAAESARGILARLMARPFIERLDAAVARALDVAVRPAARRVDRPVPR